MAERYSHHLRWSGGNRTTIRLGAFQVPIGEYVETGRYWRSELDDVVAECMHGTGFVIYHVVWSRCGGYYATLPGAKTAARLYSGNRTSSTEKRAWFETDQRGQCRGEQQ